MINITHQVCKVDVAPEYRSWSFVGEALAKELPAGQVPIRVIAVKAEHSRLWFEVATATTSRNPAWGSLLQPNPGASRRRGRFVVGSIIPTGVRAEFGGPLRCRIPAGVPVSDPLKLFLGSPKVDSALLADRFFKAGGGP